MGNTILGLLGNHSTQPEAQPDLAAQAKQMIANNNPAMLQAIEYTKQHGGDPRTALNALIKERGINPSQIMSQFGIKL